MTISSPEGSSSIFTSRKVTPRCFRKYFVRQQSGHHFVLYMVMGSIFLGFLTIRCAQGSRVAASVSKETRGCFTILKRVHCAAWWPPGCESARAAAPRWRGPNRYLGHWMPSVFPRGPAPLWRVASRSLLHARRFPQEWWHGPEGPQQIHE